MEPTTCSEAAEISKQTGHNTKSVSDMVQKQMETVKEASGNAAVLNQVSNELRVQIQRFLI